MDITPLIAPGLQVIQGYSSGGFRINGKRYEGAFLVFPDQTLPWAAARDPAQLTQDDFSQITERLPRPEIVLLGCGAQPALLLAGLRQALKQKGIILEVMDTGAACRTYNVLMAEGRPVAAALLPVV